MEKNHFSLLNFGLLWQHSKTSVPKAHIYQLFRISHFGHRPTCPKLNFVLHFLLAGKCTIQNLKKPKKLTQF